IGDTTCVRCGASLAALLRHPDPYVRVTAATALADPFASAGSLADQQAIVDSLVASLDDKDPATRGAAARALIMVRGDAAPIQTRKVLFSDRSLYARVSAMSGLRNPKIQQSWIGFLGSRLSPERETLERMTAAEMLGARAEKGSVELLRGGLTD